MVKIAVIADPHFHDITYRPGTDVASAIRTLADTCGSTRIFNESYHALKALLDDIVRRQISIVIVNGDLSDDGQAATMSSAAALLRQYAATHGLRFFATPGNHDLYAIHGRHQSKRFIDADGGNTLVTSDPAAAIGRSTARVVTAEMYCGGYERALRDMAEFGFFRGDEVRHWETPFGDSDDLEARTFEIRSADGETVRRMIDASYLVEPVEGLWLLSIDSNVFEPKPGDRDPTAEKSYIDSTDAGWNSMLRNKPFIFDWMRDVARRAAEGGKRLLTFSHYPIIDPLNGSTELEAQLLGNTSFVRRSPAADVALAAAATGIKIHFSGHLHINDTALVRDGDDFLVNVAVPSMVGFPPAYKIASFEGDRLEVETVTIASVAGYDAAFDLYRVEAAATGEDFRDLLDASDHADFLSRHLAEMVRRRYLPKEWPADLARLVPELTLADLWRIAGVSESLNAEDVRPGPKDEVHAWGAVPFMDLMVDWYRLRKGREIAFDFIPADRLEAYRVLARRYAAGSWTASSAQARLASFLSILESYLDSNPSRNFAVDLRTGRIEARPATYLGRTDLRQMGVA
ncbi:metallophosphoesterase family protein [Microvirga brassicacearum]|uniref:Phosphoesterase n=1 Tax=Microvirga brassicacearum TaxID=2580413 RepID=A0A5N3PCM3_9HYPH|nr:metallophosphoesterase [Microvirga brassicacearum]KAB0267450.1 phosphoesterase [Microvirga brassicacearum]